MSGAHASRYGTLVIGGPSKEQKKAREEGAALRKAKRKAYDEWRQSPAHPDVAKRYTAARSSGATRNKSWYEAVNSGGKKEGRKFA